jgi:nucleolar protein 6
MVEKLSKRKKKALAFRGKKGSSKDEPENEERKAIPTEEVETTEKSSWLGNDVVKGKSTKRKRTEDEQEAPPKPKKSKRKAKKNSEASMDATSPPQKKQNLAKPTGNKRYIVFLGNLPHQPADTLQPAITAHFPIPPIHIRIPTKKTTNAPQGYAFLEFDSSSALEKALRLHHTVLLGRKVNVELTAGGGGRGENRMGKIKVRNEGLEEERRRRVLEDAAKEKKDDETGGIHPDRLKMMKKQKTK